MFGPLLVLVVGGLSLGSVLAPHWRTATSTPEEVFLLERSVHYSNCDAARAAGAAPIHQGQPGYREGLDGDFDGVACEPYRGID